MVPKRWTDPYGTQEKHCVGWCDFGGVIGALCEDEAVAALCVNPYTDPSHCGACGYACAPGQACIGGGCTAPCNAGTICGVGPTAGCVDTANDQFNCGGCGIKCDGAGKGGGLYPCVDGGCVSPDGG